MFAVSSGEAYQFTDGALGSFGSALLEPYEDRPQSTGSLLINGSTIKELTSLWAQAGYQVNIHGIGDRANRYIVDAFEAAYSKLCPDLPTHDCQMKHRFRIEHAQIIHPDDQARMFAMGIIPSIQPTHATSDMSYAESRLGPERTAKEAYQMRSFLPLNPLLGSDFPVEPPNPLHGIYAAVTRRSPRTGKGKDGADDGWHIEETLNLTTALRGFTTASAWGAFLENKAGVIQEGSWADWVVLDSETPFDRMLDDELLTVQVKETWVGGKLVYKRHD
jgi:predicted amidohydrolase YtcJ